jgi:hypothetical protein
VCSNKNGDYPPILKIIDLGLCEEERKTMEKEGFSGTLQYSV